MILNYMLAMFITISSGFLYGMEESKELLPCVLDNKIEGKRIYTLDSYQELVKNCIQQEPFLFVNVGLSEEELVLLETLDITTTDEYSRFGDLHLLEDEIPRFLAKISTTNEQHLQLASKIIITLIHTLIKISMKETAWVVLRASEPDSEFKIPRWHIDGGYYKPYNANPPKFVMTLKGPHTLFYPASSSERNEVRKCQEDRQYLATLLDSKKIITLEGGKGAFFLVGNESAGVHSEPDITTPRLFLALVFGSNQQISELKKRFTKTRTYQNFL